MFRHAYDVDNDDDDDEEDENNVNVHHDDNQVVYKYIRTDSVEDIDE